MLPANLFRNVAVPAAIAMAVLSGCSVPAEPTDVHDPYESVNRVTHEFNVALDAVALRPAAHAYGAAVPQPVRQRLDNAAGNLALPSAILNKALQGEIEDAGHNFFRFLINSTLGVFGLFDPAQDFGLEAREASFGGTLAKWGAPEGAYLVLPVVGPTSERDAAALIVDVATNPVGFLFGDDVNEARIGLAVASTLNDRYTFRETFDSILYDSADSYVQLRLYYLDSRRFQLGEAEDIGETDLYEDLYDDLYAE